MRRLILVLGAFLLAGCGALEDNGTHLAFALEKGANTLRAKSATELVVHYETLDGLNQSYYVEITPSFIDPAQTSGIWGSYLVVSGQTSGGTSYHNRFVFVPTRLFIEKEKGGTAIVLRKEGDSIDVVAVR